ncbi:hypothetical protein GEMRC1_001474 [Eukaryota sp. GEM-RC1]
MLSPYGIPSSSIVPKTPIHENIRFEQFPSKEPGPQTYDELSKDIQEFLQPEAKTKRIVKLQYQLMNRQIDRVPLTTPVFVRNLPMYITSDKFWRIMSSFGEIKNYWLVSDKATSNKLGYAEFGNN